MVYVIRTHRATAWDEPEEPKPPSWRRPFSVVPEANPNYERVLHLVDAWLIEFPDEDPSLPWREIGLDAEGEPVLAGPTEDDHGFWLDTNMERSDFSEAEEVPGSLFERLWSRFFADHPHLAPRG